MKRNIGAIAIQWTVDVQINLSTEKCQLTLTSEQIEHKEKRVIAIKHNNGKECNIYVVAKE